MTASGSGDRSRPPLFDPGDTGYSRQEYRQVAAGMNLSMFWCGINGPYGGAKPCGAVPRRFRFAVQACNIRLTTPADRGLAPWK